jgi:polyisoprenoid-binding protein YceI
VAGKLPELRLQVRVHIREREQVLTVPVTLTESSEMLTVQGEVTLLQSDFGIAPYVALFGAIAVQDGVRVKFELIARLARP